MANGPIVLTANDLRTGKVVYWSCQDCWSKDPEQAFIAINDSEKTHLETILVRPEIDVEVVGAYLIEATQNASEPLSLTPNFPKKLRESRRIFGPSRQR